MICVFVINGARGFEQSFLQLVAIFWIMGFFDRICIDGLWVGHTKAWVIPGTEAIDAADPREGARQEMAGDADFLSRGGRARLLADGDDFVNAEKTEAASRMAADFGLLLYWEIRAANALPSRCRCDNLRRFFTV